MSVLDGRDARARAALHEAAIAIVAVDGADGLSPERLAEVARVDERAVERVYPDALTALTVTYDAVAASIVADLAAGAAGKSSGTAALRGALRALLTRLDRRPAEARLCFQEIVGAGREAACHHEAVQQRIVAMLCDTLQRMRPSRHVDELRVEMLVGAVFQWVSTNVDEPHRRPFSGSEPELVQATRAFAPLLG